MKMRITYIIATLALFLLGPRLVEEQSIDYSPIETDDCYTENTTFQQGERVVYKVYYNWNFVWLSAGEVVFDVTESEHEYRIAAVGRTYASYEWFFKVRDYYYTYLDKETLLPKTFIRDITEGGYSLYDKIEFDQENRSGTSFRGKTKDVAKLHNFELDQCMHDMLSIVYKMRNIDYDEMDANSSIPVKVFLDLETYPLEIKTEGKESKKWVKGQGYFKTIKISPELIAGNVFDENQRMNIWVSDDDNKIPLIIESPVSVGSLKVVLKEYSGLKHPFSSKIEK